MPICDGHLCNYMEFNWYATASLGEEYNWRRVGKDHVTKIVYHEPKGDGDRHFCDVSYDTGVQERIFNINKVEFI